MHATIIIEDFTHWNINGKDCLWRYGQKPFYAQLRDKGYTSVSMTNNGKTRHFDI